LPVPAYVHALAPLAHELDLARLRLSKAPIQTNMQLGVASGTRGRRCRWGCDEITDTLSAQRWLTCGLPSLTDADLGRLMDEVITLSETVDAIHSRFHLLYYQSYFRAISLIGCVSPVYQ
jgi:hypothetical protein